MVEENNELNNSNKKRFFFKNKTKKSESSELNQDYIELSEQIDSSESEVDFESDQGMVSNNTVEAELEHFSASVEEVAEFETIEAADNQEEVAAESAPAEAVTVSLESDSEPTEATEPKTPESEPEAAQKAPNQGSEAEEKPAAKKYPVLKAESTTSLIFFAPDLPQLSSAQALPTEDQSSSVRRRSRRRVSETSAVESKSNQQNNQRKNSGNQANTAVAETPSPVRGSTRIEAKRQRRRDSRDNSRRRQIVTEVEFLARRHAADRQMVVREKDGITEIAVIEDKILAEHYVTRSHNASLIGNVYLGKVQNVLPSMEAAFVDIGRGRNAVLYSGEVDWDNADVAPNSQRRIELALKTGDSVLVQITKDPVGHKGARLTSQISLPGRYLVYVPNGAMNGISRKLPETERTRLKKILKEILPENSGVIVRTAAEGATREQLERDVKHLTSQWEELNRKAEKLSAPVLLHSEQDLLIKIIRDVFNEDFQKLIISGSQALQTIKGYLSQIAPDLLDRIEEYTGKQDIFSQYRINEQIEKALDRKVWLPSGGSLIIDRTEAMTVIDVNTGKFVGSGGNLEETVSKNNLEAAEEIVRQLRLRDIGGIIVIDFIDMVLESNRELILRRLVECLSRDRTKHQVAEVTSLGLVQMTRKKIGLGLMESFAEVNNAKPENNSRRTDNRAKAPVADPKQNSNGTHAITDDVKNALAQIVASTISATSELEEPTELAAQNVVNNERSRARNNNNADFDETFINSEANPQTEELTILDIPIKKRRDHRSVPTTDVPKALNDVLDSLAEAPKSRKSRRVQRDSDGSLKIQ